MRIVRSVKYRTMIIAPSGAVQASLTRLEEVCPDHGEHYEWYRAFFVKYNASCPHMGITMRTPRESIPYTLSSERLRYS